MRNIFLDCGAWNGCSVDFFRENYPDGDKFEVFCFECLPANIEILRKRKDIRLVRKAVWVKNEFVKFFTASYTESGTLYSGKTTGGVSTENPISVETINLVEFIKDNFSEDDNIVLKLNIEGAEYDVIKHMAHHGILGWINKYYIQWHWNKIRGFEKSRHDTVSSMIKWHSWDAMLNNVEKFKESL